MSNVTGKITSKSTMDFMIGLNITEDEARALEAIVGYGTKPFLECFYKHMGEYYLQPYEKGVYSLFETIKNEIRPHLNKMDDCRSVFIGSKKAVDKK